MRVEIQKPKDGYTGKSLLREQTDFIFDGVARGIHKVAPRITPDHITHTGTALAISGFALAEMIKIHPGLKTPTLRKTAAGLQVLGALLDKLDGSLAKVINEQTPGAHDSKQGQITDVKADRTQEQARGAMAAFGAHLRQDLVGEAAALLNLKTSVKPSLSRAEAEKEGIFVPEMGRNPLQMFGTRGGRVVLNLFSTNIDKKVLGVSLQAWIDLFGSLANMQTYNAREAARQETQPTENPTEKQIELKENAALRAPVLVKSDRTSDTLATGIFLINRMATLVRSEKAA